MTPDQKINVLMVDDQPAKLLSYEVILADLHENLIKASSATEALNILLKTDIAVVLMDVSMPDVDGFELADVIRQHPRFQKTAIIFISGVALADSDKIQGYRSGAVDYISVPVIPEVLRAKVGIFVELHRKTRMLEKLNVELERRVEARTEELRESEARFRTRADLLELASEAIIVRDLNGVIQFWNAGAEALYGWTIEEAVGQDLHRLLQTTFPVSRSHVEGLLAENKSWRGNLTQQTRGGNEIVVACRKTMNREGNAVLEVNRDITSQVKAEEALRESEKLAAMGRVAGIIAHEINNPLAAITNIFYLLRNHPSLNEEARSYADAAEQELVRVSHITRQTLSFYRESKQPTPVRVHELLDDVVELQHRAFQVNKIELHKRYTEASSVTGFPVELRQVFMNLIANAVQAMPDGGTLRLHVHETTDWVTRRRGPSISVIDTGVGVKPEDARRLFEPFYSTKAAKGTGLGLWISKGILQKYSGRISYRSFSRDGKNVTCFRVFIPGTLTSAPESVDEPGAIGRKTPARGDEPGWQAEPANSTVSATL
ncbi:MAG TPA: ATP-binding protein [Terracidiphilus sp.]|jgi:PAS domain S-box-containing protein|nr:ATP-binding protein [Terracidiphilus sp.]